jgi:hypothetical protein
VLWDPPWGVCFWVIWGVVGGGVWGVLYWLGFIKF